MYRFYRVKYKMWNKQSGVYRMNEAVIAQCVLYHDFNAFQ